MKKSTKKMVDTKKKSPKNIEGPNQEDESRPQQEQPRQDESNIIEDGDYDSDDLALGSDLSIGDFEDPDYYSDEDDEDEDDDEDDGDDTTPMLFGLLSNFLEYDNQNVVEVLCQIRDSIDSNSKCMLRVAHELRSLHNTYIHSLLADEDDEEESETSRQSKQIIKEKVMVQKKQQSPLDQQSSTPIPDNKSQSIKSQNNNNKSQTKSKKKN